MVSRSVTVTRASILEAINAGVTTSPEIVARLGARQDDVSRVLYTMRRAGRLISFYPEDTSIVGRPILQWRVDESWRPAVRSPETCAKYAEICRRTRRDPEAEARRSAAYKATMAAKRGIEIPSWVLVDHRKTFFEIARVLGEEDAAHWARQAKRQLEAVAASATAKFRKQAA